MEELKEMLCDELDKMAGKTSITKADLENIHMLTDTIKNIGKIKMQEGEDYSGDGEWTARGNYSRAMSRRSRDSYGDNSYTNDYYIGEGTSRASRSMAASMEERMRDPNLSHEEKETLRRAMSLMR